MEWLVPQHRAVLDTFIGIAKRDSNAELECKLLAGKIQTKDVVDRILECARALSLQPPEETTYMTISYPNNQRIRVDSTRLIHKACVQNSYTGIPLSVERKERYYDGKQDVLELPEIQTKITLRKETPLRKDTDEKLTDTKAYIRVINRRSYKVGRFAIDISMVKSGKGFLRTILKQPYTYELEIELLERTKTDNLAEEMMGWIEHILKAYYQTGFLLKASDIQRYESEFRRSGHRFFNPITMVRKHIRPSNPDSIAKGYTATNKADGERSGLYVATDGLLLRITPKMQITWTGYKSDTAHIGDFLDGEYIAEKTLFCIFDVYRFRKVDRTTLPLMTTDTDTSDQSRLGCAHLFLSDLKAFQSQPINKFRIETKMFLAGDGVVMEEAIAKLLSTQFEYKTDGLIFTPRASPVAPSADRVGMTWKKVYKWKPASQNSIDFLVRIVSTNIDHAVGELYVSRNANDTYVYPREMMTGEYIPRVLPTDFELANTARVPSLFQPSMPRTPEAYRISIPLNNDNRPVDSEGQRVEDNTIIECAYDVASHRWNVMRTRYDKTYQYKVLHEAQYGNDVAVANSIWTSMHVPITEIMLQQFVSSPIDDTMEDDMYYRDDVRRSSRVFSNVYAFHNRIKNDLYGEYMVEGDTLLELAVGKGGDLEKWIRNKPSKIVGLDASLSNLVSPVDSASKRYLDRKKEGRLPPLLLVHGSFTHYPLFEQDDVYMPILLGHQQGSTEYLKHFEGIHKFEKIACQFAMHYACESEETFRNFAKNIQDSCTDTFFGTCSDGKSIYSLLFGPDKTHHRFIDGGAEAGEYTKKYQDREGWSEEFGMPVSVFLESFVKPEIEFLVPFQKVVDIMAEMGFDLAESKLFSEIYESQTQVVLTEVQQSFSFLNRTFVFKRSANATKPVPEEEKEPEEKEEPEEKKEPKQDEAPKKRKLKKGPVAEPEPEPVLFFGADESKGEYRGFSNMAEYGMEIDGIKYPSVEHYFQAMKAVEFKDDESLKKIMKTKTGKAVKAVGRKVANFTDIVWDARKEDVMKKAVRAKFVQHPALRKLLLDTGDKIIGEANPRDLYWGIGTSATQEKAKIPSKWRGKNRLGHILMELRAELKDSV